MGKTLSDIIEDFQDPKKSPNTLIADEKGNMKRRKEWRKIERFRIWLNKWWVFVLLFLAAAQVFQAIYIIIHGKAVQINEWKEVPTGEVSDGILTKGGKNEEIKLPDGTIIYKMVLDNHFYYVVIGKSGVAIVPR